MKYLIAIFSFLLCASSAHAVQYSPALAAPPILTVTVTGPGSVSSLDGGISNCTATSGTCSAQYTSGTSITLTGTANPSNASSTVHGTGGEAYGNWSGACSSVATGTCVFSITTTTSATIGFTPKDSDIWWLNPTGSDSNTGRSRSSPFATWNHVVSVMAAGDTVYLDDGTYNQSIGTASSSAFTSNWVNGTGAKSTRVYGFSRSLCVPNCASSVTGAIVDGQYTKKPLYIWRSSFIEVGYLEFLHGDSNGPFAVDGSTNGNGATLTVTCSGGAVSSISTSGGSGFPTSSSWAIAPFGGGVTGARATVNTNSSGVPSSVTVNEGGTGCGSTGTTYAVAELRASNIYAHDNAFAYALPGTTGSNIIVGSNSCNGCIFERNWSWGYGSRYMIANYLGANNVLRQNVTRYDGSPNGQPKGNVVMYDQDNGIVENNIAIDFAIGTDSTSDNHAPIFATCSASQSYYPYGLATVAWYGNIAINSTGQTNGVFQIDSHCSTNSTPTGGTTALYTIKDNVVAGQTGSTVAAFWMEGDTQGATHGGNHNIDFNHNTMWNVNAAAQSGDLFRLDNSGWGTVTFKDTILHGNTFTASGCYRQDWTGTVTSSTNLWFDCNNTLHQSTPSGTNSNPNYATSGTGGNYLERIVSGPAFGTGSGGSNIGATVVDQYQNGTLTGTALWPFPNEALIQADLCKTPDTNVASVCETNGNTSCTIYTRTHNTTGFCATSTVSLTKYIWQQLGATSPF